MKKIFEKFRGHRSPNNEGMTLVEVLVGSAIFAILAGLICLIANSSLRMQTNAEYWNEQTDMQSGYLSANRYDAVYVVDADGNYVLDADGNKTKVTNFSGGGTNYALKIEVDDATNIDIGANVEVYSVDTQYAKNEAGDDMPTYEDANIYFFRVHN